MLSGQSVLSVFQRLFGLLNQILSGLAAVLCHLLFTFSLFQCILSCFDRLRRTPVLRLAFRLLSLKLALASIESAEFLAGSLDFLFGFDALGLTFQQALASQFGLSTCFFQFSAQALRILLIRSDLLMMELYLFLQVVEGAAYRSLVDLHAKACAPPPSRAGEWFLPAADDIRITACASHLTYCEGIGCAPVARKAPILPGLAHGEPLPGALLGFGGALRLGLFLLGFMPMVSIPFT